MHRLPESDKAVKMRLGTTEARMAGDVTLTGGEPKTWLEFWTGDHAIYVDERHRDAHYRRLAEDITAQVDLGGRTVLDFGCGEALAAPRLAAHCRQLLLYDPAPDKADRWIGHDGIRVLSDADWTALAPSSLDVVLVISVVQYLGSADLDALLRRLHGVLRPGGSVLFADVVPPRMPVWRDVLTLLGTGWHHGFLWPAFRSLAKTWFSPYRRLREQVGFTTYAPDAFLARLAAAGFHPRRLPRNVGFSRSRMAFLAVKEG